MRSEKCFGLLDNRCKIKKSRVQNAKDIGVLVINLKFQGVHLHPLNMNNTAHDRSTDH
jgi:hypothetical protein